MQLRLLPVFTTRNSSHSTARRGVINRHLLLGPFAYWQSEWIAPRAICSDCLQSIEAQAEGRNAGPLSCENRHATRHLRHHINYQPNLFNSQLVDSIYTLYFAYQYTILSTTMQYALFCVSKKHHISSCFFFMKYESLYKTVYYISKQIIVFRIKEKWNLSNQPSAIYGQAYKDCDSTTYYNCQLELNGKLNIQDNQPWYNTGEFRSQVVVVSNKKHRSF